MDIATTTISANGQIVIPAEIRRAANIAPATQFLVLHLGEHILLKALRPETFREEQDLLGKLAESREQVRKGEVRSIPAGTGAAQIGEILRRQWPNSSSRGHSQKHSRKSKIQE